METISVKEFVFDLARSLEEEFFFGITEGYYDSGFKINPKEKDLEDEYEVLINDKLRIVKESLSDRLPFEPLIRNAYQDEALEISNDKLHYLKEKYDLVIEELKDGSFYLKSKPRSNMFLNIRLKVKK